VLVIYYSICPINHNVAGLYDWFIKEIWAAYLSHSYTSESLSEQNH